MGARLNAMLDGGHLDADRVTRESRDLTSFVLDELADRGWTEFKREFEENGKIRLDLLANSAEINPRIEDHPLLLWIREKRGRRKL